jgi:hypothetical protein
MAADSSGEWALGIGDPSAFGWLTVASYAITASVCWRTSSAASGRDRLAWRGLMLIAVLLGINKQLDLQSFFTQEARWLLNDLGLYGMRRILQLAFICVMFMVTLIMIFGIWRKFANLSAELNLALTGLAILSLFVMVRAASFHHVDALLPTELYGISFNFFFENLGLLMIIFAALRRHKHIQRNIRFLMQGHGKRH